MQEVRVKECSCLNWFLVFDTIRFIPVIAILIVASYQDLTNTSEIYDVKKKRVVKVGQVSNKLWYYAPVGLLLTVVELAVLPQLFFIIAVSMAIAFIVAFALFAFNGWGGADAKALMMIGVSTPLTPLVRPLVTLMPVFVVFLACMSAIVVLVVGGKRGNRAIRFLPFLLLGYVLACLV